MDDGAPSFVVEHGLKRFQRFGEFGPAYEILGPGVRPGTVLIHVFETQEELDYRIDQALADPEA